MSKPHIYSIIIPHHNTPDLLSRCLQSIPQREDIQVIVVDDNSDAQYIDDVQAACDTHPNTRCFLTTEGRGAGFARNKALKQVNSKWVIFSDADDYFPKPSPSLTNTKITKRISYASTRLAVSRTQVKRVIAANT